MRAQLKISLFFCLLLGVCFPTSGKIRISGRVTSTSGDPVEFANVWLEKTSLACLTDHDGYYSFEVDWAEGILSVSSVGFEKQSKKIHSTENLRIDFILPSTGDLEEVYVTGKSNRIRLRESEFSVNTIDVSPLVNTTVKLSDLVGRTAGVRVRAEGGLGSDFDVSLNGLSGSAVRYFIDGVPMETRGNEVSLGNLPLNQVERVDIYKGVVPSYFGTDAMGGVINIITKRNKRSFLDASVSCGSFSTYLADFVGQIVDRSSGLLIRPSFDYSYSKNNYMMHDVEVWDKDADKYIETDRRRFHDAYRAYQGQLELGFENKPWAKRLFLTGSFSNINKEIQTGAVQAIVYGAPRRKSDAWSIGAQYAKDSLFLSGLNVNLNLSHTWDHSITVDSVYQKYDWNGNWIPSQRNEITGGAKSLHHYVRPFTSLKANFDYNIGSIHTLNLNYSLNRIGNTRYDDLDKEYEPSKDILTKHIAGLSYSQRLVNGRLQNTAFSKLYVEQLEICQMTDRWNEDTRESKRKSYPGYGLGSRFDIFGWLQVKASVEKAVRLPLSRELLGNGTTVSANLNLRPETSSNLNVGLFGNLFSGSDHSIYYEVGGYLRKVKNMIHLVTNENTGLSYYANISKVSVGGVEGEVSCHFLSRFHLTTNWSYSVSRDMNASRSDGKTSVTYKNRIPNRPWLYGNTEITYIHPKLFSNHDSLRIGYSYQYVHWFFLTWEGYGSLSSKSTIPTQNPMNIYATYSWRNQCYNLTFEVNNIFDQTLYDNYKLQKPGRSVMVKFRLFFES